MSAAVNPAMIDQMIRCGLDFQRVGQLEQAEKTYQDVLAADPANPSALHFLGIVASQRGRYLEGIEHVSASLKIRPDMADAWNNLGLILSRCGRGPEALEAIEKACSLQPNHAGNLNTLGSLIVSETGDLDRAMEVFHRAVKADPSAVSAHSNLLFTMHFMPSVTAQKVLDEARRWNVQHALKRAGQIKPHTNSVDPDRVLRIGYVSPDFREHCQALFMLPVLSRRDQSRYHVTCYSDVTSPDAMTQRLARYADEWRSTVGMRDEQVAAQIRADGIDILVDLTMHMTNNRLTVFAMRPAPVQITWLAYPGTTGVAAIDYRLTDRYLDPEGEGRERWYVEESIRLPHSFWCYDALSGASPARELLADKNGFITFGCLNSFTKINDVVVRYWRAILERVDNSRLVLLAPKGKCREAFLAKLGIAAERVRFVDYAPRREYLEHYHEIDICLETFPYNGHTTSLDALWMGVPVVTLVGENVVSRAGLSQLMELGLPELIARSEEEYVEKVVELAGERETLRRLHGELRGRMEGSPLMDGAGFMQDMEAVYREVWGRWCKANAKRK